MKKFKNATPMILTCISIVGMAATVVMAVKATPRALTKLKEERNQQPHEEQNVSLVEIVRVTWRCYIPTILVGVSTVACIIGINALNKRNQASLMSAYAMLNQTYQRYRKAANAVYGADADEKISTQVAKDVYVSADGFAVYSANLDKNSEAILCYDMFSQRYFTATMAAVINAQYHINRNFQLRGDVSVNEFYEFLGIDGIEHGYEIGWGAEDIMESGIMWLDFENYHSKMDDGMECCIISCVFGPTKFDCGD